MNKIFLVIPFVVFFSCSNAIEFHKLNIDVSGEVEQQIKFGIKNYNVEYFVIKNPPVDYEKLKTVIDSFNTISLHLPNTPGEYKIIRFFYRETPFTPRQFREFKKNRGYFNGDDDITRHSADLLVQQEFYKGPVESGIFYTFFKKGNILEPYSSQIINKSGQ